MRKIFVIAIILFNFSIYCFATDLPRDDVSYVLDSETDKYRKQRCKLDIVNIPDVKNFPTLVWFHGGGISGGDKKSIPLTLKNEKSFALISVNYRLSPKIKAHNAIDDAAEAIAWVFENIEKYGGDKSKIFVGGHSAGAYLSGMVAFAPKYLQKFNIKNTDIAGAILLSGQATTHFRVRKDLGDKSPQYLPKIDELSLIGNSSNKLPPICIVVGDRRIEFKERVEENFLLASCINTLKSSERVEIYELQGLTHGTVALALAPIAKTFVARVIKNKKTIMSENKTK